jgi:hypothetical protein
LEVSSAVLLKKIRSGTHSDPEFGRRGGGVSYIDARKKKVPERRSGMRPCEKELTGRRTVAKIRLEVSGHGLILRYCSGIRLERLRKTTKNRHNSRSPGRDLNPGPPEYEVGMLTTLL